MNTRLAPRPTADRAPSAADREARLAALAARRGPAATPAPSTATSGRDALDARLAALAARRPPAPSASPAPTSRTNGRGKRRHAAQGSRIASLGLSLASTGALATFFAMSSAGTGNQVQAAAIVATPASAGTVATPATAAAAPSVVALTIPPAGTVTAAQPAATTLPATTLPATTVATTVPATAVPVAAAAQTVVQGGVFSNKWGEVQVQATFAADGSLVDVVTLETPSRDRKSVRINDRAVPVLNDEALTIQSAQVDTVSGATYTSNDYRRSLQSAIDAAREAGLTTLA